MYRIRSDRSAISNLRSSADARTHDTVSACACASSFRARHDDKHHLVFSRVSVSVSLNPSRSHSRMSMVEHSVPVINRPVAPCRSQPSSLDACSLSRTFICVLLTLRTMERTSAEGRIPYAVHVSPAFRMQRCAVRAAVLARVDPPRGVVASTLHLSSTFPPM